MVCKLCRFAYACRALRKDDMNIEKARELLHKIRSETNLAPCIATLDSIKMLAKQALSELEAASESRTDRLLDELADNMAKADEAMKPDKPLEQSEFTREYWMSLDNKAKATMLQDAIEKMKRDWAEIDRQAAEIKRLKEQNEILKNKYQVLVYVLCSDIDVACQEARPCTVDNLRDYIGFALDIARQYGLSETIKDKKQALKERK